MNLPRDTFPAEICENIKTFKNSFANDCRLRPSQDSKILFIWNRAASRLLFYLASFLDPFCLVCFKVFFLNDIFFQFRLSKFSTQTKNQIRDIFLLQVFSYFIWPAVKTVTFARFLEDK